MSEPITAASAVSTSPAPAKPVAAAPASPDLITKIGNDLTVLKTHAVAIVVSLVLAAALVAGGVYGVNALLYRERLAQEVKADAQLAAQVQQTQKALDMLAASNQQVILLAQTVATQNAQLQQQKQIRDTQSQKQVQIDATLDAAGAASRLSQQTGANPGEVTVSGNTIILDLPITQRIVEGFDQLATAKADLADTATQLQNETALAAKQDQTIKDANAAIADLKAQNAEQVKAAALEVSALKAKHRKSIFKWVAGTATVVYLVVKLGIVH
jgi:hypothetical protein